MHNARIETSDRLQRVLEYLRDGKPKTTREIIVGANVCAVNSCISELRANGYGITCKAMGKGLFQYQFEVSGT